MLRLALPVHSRNVDRYHASQLGWDDKRKERLEGKEMGSRKVLFSYREMANATAGHRS